MTRAAKRALEHDFGADGEVGQCADAQVTRGDIDDAAPAISAGTVANPSAVQPARSARSIFPAPRFCPTMAAAVAPKPTPIVYSQLSTRWPRPNAASAGVPKRVVVRVSAT